jgi:hypothetical protein
LAKFPTSTDQVVASTLAANGTGIYLLTDAPGIWFYKFADDSLASIKTAGDSWPAAAAVSSYLSNLYLVGQDTVYKATPSAAGFGAAASYLDATNGDCLAGASSLAVNGSVYVTSATSLCEYLAGVQKNLTTLPVGLAGSVQAIKVSGQSLLTVSPKTQRVGLWDISTAPAFLGQYQVKDTSSLDDAAVDPKTDKLYVLSAGKLLTFKP